MSVTVDQLQQEQTDGQKPGISNKTLIEMVLGILFFVLLFWQVNTLLDPSTLPIKQVRIEGKFRHLSPQSLEMLVSDKVKGGFFNIDVMSVRNALMKEPWVSDVSVHRVWPDSLQVFVTEQVPMTTWRSDSLLNTHGDIFTPDRNSFPDNLPALSGPEGTEKLVLKHFQQLHEELKIVSLDVKSLTLDERRAWSFETTSGIKVMVGKNHFDKRVKRLVELVPQYLAGELEKAERIDLRYPNGFAIRWKQGQVAPKTATGNTSNG